MNRNIKEILKEWGMKNKKVPQNNLSLKSEIFSKLSACTSKEEARFLPKRSKFPWLSASFAVFAILVFLGNFGISSFSLKNSEIAPTGTSIFSPQSSYPPMMDEKMQNSDGASIDDTREFIKTNYSASIRTRNVSDTTQKVVDITRSFGGRVDASSSGEKYGYINFAIPADRFEIFRNEIKDLSRKKLFVENISSLNFLPQKQTIEENQRQTESSLTILKNELLLLKKNYDKSINSHNVFIAELNQEKRMLEAEWQISSEDKKVQITSRILQIQTQKNILAGEINSENRIYQDKYYNLNLKIKNIEANLSDIKTQDKNLMKDIATVSGRISISWISLWEMADLYLPGPILAWILAMFSLIFYVKNRW